MEPPYTLTATSSASHQATADVTPIVSSRRSKEKEEKWNAMFSTAADYFSRHGASAPIPWGAATKDLAHWVSQQRLLYLSGKLKTARQTQLESIGFRWTCPSSSSSQWNQKGKDAKSGNSGIQRKKDKSVTEAAATADIKRQLTHNDKPRNAHDDLILEPTAKKVSFDGTDTFALESVFLPPQKNTEHATNDVSPREASSGNSRDDRWNRMFELIVTFKKQWGHMKISKRQDRKLYYWFNLQKRLHRRGWLREDRLKLLRSIGSEEEFDGTDTLALDSVYPPVQNNTEHATNEPVSPRGGFKSTHEASGENSHDMQWNRMFELLVAFKKQWGHMNISTRQDKKLYYWFTRQKEFHRRGWLREERLKLLRSIGFEEHLIEIAWRKKRVACDSQLLNEGKPLTKEQQERWKTKFEQLKEYVSEYGNAHVPFYCPENQSLARWVSNQRHRYNRGVLRKDRRDLLESIGFVWDVVSSKAANNQDGTTTPSVHSQQISEHWKTKFSELQEYVQKHGNVLVPYNWVENRPLGQWVAQQRNLYDRSKLAKNRRELLDSIGFVWNERDTFHSTSENDENKMEALDGSFTCDQASADPERDQSEWTTMFELLVEYLEEHGDTCVPRDWSLGQWVQRQCLFHKLGMLDQHQFKMLESIGFDWNGSVEEGDVTDNDSEASYHQQEKDSTTCISSSPTNHSQSQDVEHGKIEGIKNGGDDVQMNMRSLEATTASADATHQAFQGTEALLFDSTDILMSAEEDGSDANQQREMESKKPAAGLTTNMEIIDDDRENGSSSEIPAANETTILPKIRDDVVSASDVKKSSHPAAERHNETWMKNFNCLVEYQKQHGDTLVPSKWAPNRSLAAWVRIQRHYCNKGKLKKWRERKLESIGFVWTLSKKRSAAAASIESEQKRHTSGDADNNDGSHDELNISKISSFSDTGANEKCRQSTHEWSLTPAIFKRRKKHRLSSREGRPLHPNFFA